MFYVTSAVSKLRSLVKFAQLGINSDHATMIMEELLREAACLGNLDAVQKLLGKGASINSQHNLNGWY